MNRLVEALHRSQQWVADIALPWVREWEKRPLPQRKRHVLAGFMGLMLILLVKVNAQLTHASLPLNPVRFTSIKLPTRQPGRGVTNDNKGDYLNEKQRRSTAHRRISSASQGLTKGEKDSSSLVPPVPNH